MDARGLIEKRCPRASIRSAVSSLKGKIMTLETKQENISTEPKLSDAERKEVGAIRAMISKSSAVCRKRVKKTAIHAPEVLNEAYNYARPSSFFHIEDGVQCEVCHGPASQHVAMKMNKERTVKAQFKRLTKEDCMMCHKEKTSHEVLKGKKFNYENGWKRIAHPIPTEGKK
jgi:hypothetical protein